MKLYEYIVTSTHSTEVYKGYRYYKNVKEAKREIGIYGMELVRLRAVAEDEYISDDIIDGAKKELLERLI